MTTSTERISWFPVPDESELPEDLRGLFRAARERIGFVPNVFRAYSFRPERLSAWFQHFRLVMEGTPGLSEAEREMIAVVVSMANGCLYCLVAHGAALRQAWGDPVMADRITLDWRRAEGLTERQRAICALAEKATTSPVECEEQDLDALRAHGLSDEDVWDVIEVAAMYNFTNRLAQAGGQIPNAEYHALARARRGSADRAAGQLDRLGGVRARDEVRPGGDHAALLREQAVARALRQQGDRQVALEVGLLVDGEADPPGAHRAEDVGAEVERPDLRPAGRGAGAAHRLHRLGARGGVEGEQPVDPIARDRGREALRRGGALVVDADDARAPAGGAHRLGEAGAARVEPDVADLLVDAQRAADAGGGEAPAGEHAGAVLGLADMGEDAEAA